MNDTTSGETEATPGRVTTSSAVAHACERHGSSMTVGRLVIFGILQVAEGGASDVPFPPDTHEAGPARCRAHEAVNAGPDGGQHRTLIVPADLAKVIRLRPNGDRYHDELIRRDVHGSADPVLVDDDDIGLPVVAGEARPQTAE
ncbi:MAG: hypothetical protein KJ062_01200, partial [Thermoanaerobaculia bacterium]|nr:hypothetical protein [Thermoanaerobaculia bacterium]